MKNNKIIRKNNLKYQDIIIFPFWCVVIKKSLLEKIIIKLFCSPAESKESVLLNQRLFF